jgi:hypothetical protein
MLASCKIDDRCSQQAGTQSTLWPQDQFLPSSSVDISLATGHLPEFFGHFYTKCR